MKFSIRDIAEPSIFFVILLLLWEVLVEIIKYAENKYASWIGVADVRVTE